MTIKLIPKEILEKNRVTAQELWKEGKPKKWYFALPIIIAKRIRNEEKVLEEELQGYTEYKTRVKYKVIPFIW